MTQPTEEASGEYCPNCNSLLYGQFCFSCGQNQKGVNRFFWSIINESLDNLFSRNSKVFLSLAWLMLRPGFLAVEYFDGRRARYVQPIRLYIFTSLAFFSLLSLSHYVSDDIQIAPGVNAQGEANLAIITSDNETGDISDNLDETKESINEFHIGWFDEETNIELRERLKKKVEELSEDGASTSKSILSDFIESAPLGLVILVPVFSLVLKLFYALTGIYYTQHLVLTVYNHSFIFLTLSINLVLGLVDQYLFNGIKFVTNLLEFWILIYVFISQKAFYQQGWFLTTIKFLTLGMTYSVLFIAIYLLILIASILL